MKNILKYNLVAIFVTSLTTSCSMNIMEYNEDIDYIYVADVIEYGVVATNQNLEYSFYEKPDTLLQDTVYFDIEMIGFTSTEDRPFALKQKILVAEEGEAEIFNAEENVHYVSLSDSDIVSQYVLKAGEITAKVPIVLKRDESLKQNERVLCLELVDNEFFEVSSSDKSIKVITFNEIMSKPELWNTDTDRWIGSYGRRKHEIMLEWVAQSGIMPFNSVIKNINSGSFWKDYLVSQLKTYLNKLIEAGVDINEYPEYGGEPVVFSPM